MSALLKKNCHPIVLGLDVILLITVLSITQLQNGNGNGNGNTRAQS